MGLLDYNKYINSNEAALTPEQIAERKKQALASHMRMYISKKLSIIFKKMESPIAKELLGLSRKNIRFDISFMDKSGEDGMVTFINTIKVKKLEQGGLNISTARNNYKSELWKSAQRVQPTRIGKVVGKIFKGKFSTAQIEQFGNEFKAKSITVEDDKLRIVYGKEINKWYLESNYAQMKSSLGNSCMKQSNRNTYMNFYSDNKPGDKNYSHVGMLILLNDNNKLMGRAIVWFNSIKPEPGRTFMDRIYTSNDSDQITFMDYAKKNDWLYKKQQSYDNTDYIDPRDGRSHKMAISFRLKEDKFYDNYPYCDTLNVYTPKTGRIGNTKGKNKKYDQYSLRSTGGGSDRA